MIETYFESLEKAIVKNPLVLLIDLYKTYTSPNTAYIKGEITFIDDSSLILFQHVRRKREEVDVTEYRFHYMDKDNILIFRYDNAPHHHEINSFPHHKHSNRGTLKADKPTIKEILEEVNSEIIKRIKPRGWFY